MRKNWDPEDVVGAWTLVEDDWRLVANKSGPTRLGFAVLLKFFEQGGRFPSSPQEVPTAAVAYVARQAGVDPDELRDYDWGGRSIKYHRAQIRAALGFREPTRGDEAKLTAWLAEEVAPTENDDALREAVLARCRAERIEPPGRLDRVVASARAAATTALCVRTVSRLPAEVVDRLERLGRGEEDADDGDRRVLLAELKTDPARLSLETLLGEMTKLERVRALGVPEGVFDGVADRVVEAWRARAATEYPSDLADHPAEVRLSLLAALCHCRRADITDGLVDLLIALVHRLKTRAENRVEQELVADLRRVRNKQEVLFRLGPGGARPPRPDRARGALPGGGRGDPARSRRRGRRRRGVLPCPGAHRAALVVLEPLPPHAAPAARDPRVPLQHRPLSCPRGDHPLAPLRLPTGLHSPLRRGRDRPPGRRGPLRVAGGGGGRGRPHRADPLRAVRPAVASRRPAPPRGVGRRRPAMAGPGGRPAHRLRAQP